MLIFSRHFSSLVEDTQGALQVVLNAADQVRRSTILRSAFPVLLALGNELNSGTIRGEGEEFS